MSTPFEESRAINEPTLPLDLRKHSVWCWEPLDPERMCHVEVTDIEWTGREWYVQIKALEDAGHMWAGMRNWYVLDWFVEAAVLVRMRNGSRGRECGNRG